ncbi:MAG: hypothetical protein AB1468_02685 [Candidatus Micrarchaeota archaeon]
MPAGMKTLEKTQKSAPTKPLILPQLEIFPGAPKLDGPPGQLAWGIGEKIGKKIVAAGLDSIYEHFMKFVDERVRFLDSLAKKGKRYSREEIMEKVSKEVYKKIEQLSGIRDQLESLQLGTLGDNITLVLKKYEYVPRLRREAQDENKRPAELNLIIRALEIHIEHEVKARVKKSQRELF